MTLVFLKTCFIWIFLLLKAFTAPGPAAGLSATMKIRQAVGNSLMNESKTVSVL